MSPDARGESPSGNARGPLLAVAIVMFVVVAGLFVYGLHVVGLLS